MVVMLIAVGPRANADYTPDPNRMWIGTGGKTGNYYFAGNEITKRLGKDFVADGKLIQTGGSLDNLRKLMAGEVDVAFVQSDVYQQFALENPSSLTALVPYKVMYDEYVHLICPVAANWSRVTHVGKAKDSKIIVGPNGGGTAETWRILRSADTGLYDHVERLPDAPDIEALSQVKDSTNTCMLWVSGLNSADMRAANMLSVNTKDHKPALTLIDVDDRDMKNLKGQNGKPMYEMQTINWAAPSGESGGQYSNLMQSSSVNVPTVHALLVMRVDYRDALKAAGTSGRLVQAIEDALPTIWGRVNPPQK